MKKAAATRLTILQKAFDLIYARGYQTTSIDDIIATTQVTKGAFYYHFKNKDEMGIAIINEIVKPILTNSLIIPLQNEKDPLNGIYALINNLLLDNDLLKVEYGCPISNFTQEMSPWNSEFNNVLSKLSQEWIEKMTATIENGKNEGYIRKEVNAKQVTIFIISGYWGVRNFGKIENSNRVYFHYLRELKHYLESLK